MPDARARIRRVANDAPTPLNWPLVRKRCEELGARTNIEAALLMDMSPRTLDALRGGYRDTRLSVVLNARRILGLSLDEMFPAPNQQQRAA